LSTDHSDQGTVCLHGFQPDEAERLGRQLQNAGLSSRLCDGTCLRARCALGDGPGCIVTRVDGALPLPEAELAPEERSHRRRLLPLVAVVGPTALESVIDALRQGAWDILRAPAGEQELLDTICQAIQVSQAAQAESEARQRARHRLAQLTHREYEVFCAMAEGGCHRELAEALGISPRTLEVHRARLFRKLRIETYSELVRMAVAVGVLSRYPELPDAPGGDLQSTGRSP